MRLTFLGGADEIGASSILVETAGRRVLVDCGLRMGSGGRDPLPDLRTVQELGGLDAVVLTHAHLDHTGALPVLHAACPDVPVFATAPTWALVKILLLDAMKIMGQKLDREGELPLYAREAVEGLLARGTPTRFLEPVEVAGGAVTLTHHPAGHILGASAVSIQSSEGTVLISGDFSVTDQLTVPGMLPPRLRADLVVTESTYGDRMHASRPAEEQRLADTVGEVIAAGGKVLIPAFALGRAQEVILILKRAFARKRLKPFPVWVDGMVRAVCGTYADHPEWLAPWLRRRIEKKGNPFFDPGGPVLPVEKPAQRAEIAAGPPCCIVASSGMLSGGPSQQFAAMLAPDPRNLIAITGYQDEEAPGRTLLDLAEGKSRLLRVGGETVPVACRVGKYSLSAHADGNEIAALLGHLRPKDAVLVHGEGDSRPSLGKQTSPRVRHGVFLPVLGETLAFDYRGPRISRKQEALPGFSPERPVDAPTLAELAAALRDRFPATRPFELRELAAFWGGDEATGSHDFRDSLREALAAAGSPFEPDARRPFLYRIRSPEALRDDRSDSPWVPKEPSHPSGPLELNAALARIDALLPPSTGLLKKSVRQEAGAIALCFPFPAAAERRWGTIVARLAEETGWTLVFHPEVRLEALLEAARSAAPGDWEVVRTPAWHRDDNRVVLHLGAVPPGWRERTAELARRFEEETGITLELERVETGPAAPSEVRRDTGGRLEQNFALAAVDRIFRSAPHRPEKKSLRRDAEGPYLELGFVSPAVASRYGELLREAELETGWRILTSPRVNQQAILQAFSVLCPPSWSITKGPSLHLDRAMLRIEVVESPDFAEVERLREELLSRTGFDLEIARG